MVSEKNSIKLFNDKKIRTKYDYEIDDYYFSVIDVIAVLTDSNKPRDYWYRLKKRELENGIDLSTNCRRLKMPAKDGKLRETDVSNTKELLRIIQSIPSKNAEPFKQWLAQVGSERLDEIADPEKAITRGRNTYRKKGFTDEWIKQRENSIDIRNDLTDEWKRVGVEEGIEYAILTNEITQAWSGMTTNEYKQYKGMKKGNLRDNMTNLELVLNMLAEATTTEISKIENPDGFEESKEIANRGGSIAGNTRQEIESNIGHSIVSRNNSDNPELLDDSNFKPRKVVRRKREG